MVRAVAVTVLGLVLALIVIGSLGGGVGFVSFVLLLYLAGLGAAVWWQRNRSKG